MAKSADAFRSIGEVARLIGVAPHVLRYWETQFPQLSPVKRADGRRYYRPDDVRLAAGLCEVMREDGMTARGALRLMAEDKGEALRARGAERIALMLEREGQAAAKPAPKPAPRPEPTLPLFPEAADGVAAARQEPGTVPAVPRRQIDVAEVAAPMPADPGPVEHIAADLPPAPPPADPSLKASTDDPTLAPHQTDMPLAAGAGPVSLPPADPSLETPTDDPTAAPPPADMPPAGAAGPVSPESALPEPVADTGSEARAVPAEAVPAGAARPLPGDAMIPPAEAPLPQPVALAPQPLTAADFMARMDAALAGLRGLTPSPAAAAGLRGTRDTLADLLARRR